MLPNIASQKIISPTCQSTKDFRGDHNVWSPVTDVVNGEMLISCCLFQGLCGFYEKSGNPEYQDDLVNVYQNLIPLVEK